jgi:hypothetical protein
MKKILKEKTNPLTLTHSQLLEGLKCESQTENNGRQKVGAHSLARSTIEG